MGAAAVEPNVHDVAFLAEMGAAAVRAFIAFRHQFLDVVHPPGVGTVFGKHLLQVADGVIVDDVFAAVFAVEDRDRNTPDTLTGDAPVAAVVDHIVDAVMAPGRNPFDRIDGFEGFLTEAVDRSKPLFRRPIDDRVLAAPAVRILMAEGVFGKESTLFSQFLDDRYVGIEDELAFKAGTLSV